MKIGLLSRGRTISTAIIDNLALEYDLTNFGEKYFTVLENSNKINNLKKNFVEVDKFKTFQNQFSIYTAQLFSTDNFVCKLWPSMLIYRNDYGTEVTLDYVHENIIFNISKFWNLKSYDKLFFLDRDLKSSTLSWVYSKHTKKFHVSDNENINESYHKIQINNNDINTAKFYILEYCLQHKIKNSILNLNYDLTEINEPKNFVNRTQLGKIKHIIDYNKLIVNHQILDDLFIDYFEYCQDAIKDWTFY